MYGTQVIAISELKTEVKTTRRYVFLALASTFLFCALTFVMVLVATERSKDVQVVNSVLVDRTTQLPVSTGAHRGTIENPLQVKNGAGVEFITQFYPDGSLEHHAVHAFTKYACAESDSQCVDGYMYVFKTAHGDFAGHPGKNGQLTFTHVGHNTGRSLLSNVNFEDDVEYDEYDAEYDEYDASEMDEEEHKRPDGLHNLRDVNNFFGHGSFASGAPMPVEPVPLTRAESREAFEQELAATPEPRVDHMVGRLIAMLQTKVDELASLAKPVERPPAGPRAVPKRAEEGFPRNHA